MITYNIDKSIDADTNEVVLRLKNESWGPVIRGTSDEDAFEKFKTAFVFMLYMKSLFKKQLADKNLTKGSADTNAKSTLEVNINLIFNEKTFIIRKRKKSAKTNSLRPTSTRKNLQS
ncbi:MAG: hypothetical protein ACK5Z2_18525 [Bacteroidota bacterium]|jgi:hypothetical protein